MYNPLNPLPTQTTMENTYEEDAPATIGEAIAERIALTIQEDGIRKTAGRTGRFAAAVLIICGVIAPQLTMGYVYALLSWKSAAILKIVICIAAFSYYRYAPRAFAWIATKLKSMRPKKTDDLYHGIPVGELADYLLEQGAFPRENAIVRFAISRKRQFKIADELERNGILERGNANARVLRPDLSREQLVTFLRDGISVEPMIQRAAGFFTRAVGTLYSTC